MRRAASEVTARASPSLRKRHRAFINRLALSAGMPLFAVFLLALVPVPSPRFLTGDMSTPNLQLPTPKGFLMNRFVPVIALAALALTQTLAARTPSNQAGAPATTKPAAAKPAEGKSTLADLPAPVRATVEAETRNATLKGVSKEQENGKTVYELESLVNGRTRRPQHVDRRRSRDPRSACVEGAHAGRPKERPRADPGA